jgi:phosphate/phosphite/phosphonate ABC transporter binding protein
MLGEGGNGEVHLASAQGVAGFEKLVALKLLRSELSDDPRQLTTLLNEAFISANLEHENIVQIFDLCLEAGQYFIVMEYVRGFSLAQVLSHLRSTGRRLPTRVACHIVRSVANALTHVHERLAPDGKPLQLIHGDISGGNVLLSAAGRIAISDFGVGALSQANSAAAAGTWSYMPPEALLGARLSTAWDLFALGALAYEALSTRKAFPARDFAERGKCPEVPPALPEDCPPALQDIVFRAIASSPADRFKSAREFRDALNEIMPPQGNETDLHVAFIDRLYSEDRFISTHGDLPTTSSTGGPDDPFLEETETPTVNFSLQKPLRLGVSLAHGPQKAGSNGELLSTALEFKLGRKVRPVLLGDYRTLMECLLLGDVDIAWMPPITFSKAMARGAGLVAATRRQGRSGYHGVIFCKEECDIHSPSDLSGRSIAWVDRDSASGYVMPKARLMEIFESTELPFSNESFMGSHRAVCDAVFQGWTDAGCTYAVYNEGEFVRGAWSELSDTPDDKVRVVVHTKEIPAEVIAHRPGLPPTLVANISEVFCRLEESEDGKEVLEKVFAADGFDPGEVEAYEGIG